MKKLVYGKGYNDGSLPSWVDGKRAKEYQLWAGILERCFNSVCQSKNPTYKDCTVSDNFLNYTFFYGWCHKQIGFGKTDTKGLCWQIDKDLLFVGNKIYGEYTCVFVPQEINSFFVDRGNGRGEYPVGVYFYKQRGKYKSRCNVNGKPKHLGYFNTPQEAFAVYKPFKEALCKELALKWKDEIDPRLFDAMMKWEVENN